MSIGDAAATLSYIPLMFRIMGEAMHYLKNKQPGLSLHEEEELMIMIRNNPETPYRVVWGDAEAIQQAIRDMLNNPAGAAHQKN